MLNILLLGLTSLLTDVSSEMVYPLLPLFLAGLPGVSAGTAGLIVGVIEGLAESLASLTKVFSGRLADWSGRRKPLAMAGYAGSTVGKALFALAAGAATLAAAWPLVLGGRLVDRLGKGVRTAPRDALLADAAPPGARGRTFGLHRLMDTIGALSGVLLAYALIPASGAGGTEAYAGIFLAALIPGVLGVVALAAVRERRAPRPAGERGSAGVSWTAMRQGWQALDVRLRGFLIVAGIFTLGNSSNQFLLLRASGVGFDARTVLLLYAVFNLTYAVVAYPAGWLSDRIGRRALIVAGYLAYGLVYFGFAVSGAATLWPLFALYGVYNGITEGVEKALLADLAPVQLRATVMGLHATIVGIGLLPASFVAGVLWERLGSSAPFLFGAVMGLVAAVGMAVVLRGLRRVEG